MNSESVDLIATDPPFNKGRDFHATPDSLASGAKFQDRWSWERDVHDDWLDQLQDDYPAVWAVIDWSRMTYGDDMGAFLCFMAVRLLETHRILKPTGSLYLHCDPTASHYLKALLDAVFGKKNFFGEIVWNKQNGTKGKRKWGNENESIFAYAKKTNKHTLKTDDSDCRIPYAKTSVSMHFTNIDRNGRKYRERIINGKSYVYYEDEGRFIGNLWNDIPSMLANTPIKGESTGYPTQKPLSLYSRIIKASSNEGDIVLDPFAGCATTLVAAEILDRQWVGIDIWDNAEKVILKRMEKEGLTVSGSIKTRTYGKTMNFTNKIPERTDDGIEAAPFLRVKERVKEPEGQRWSRQKMYDYLIEQQGSKCQGCNREFDDPRYLELDHNTPRSDGGINHISNRILLCGPCNKLKSNKLTLSGLQNENRKRGYMR